MKIKMLGRIVDTVNVINVGEMILVKDAYWLDTLETLTEEEFELLHTNQAYLWEKWLDSRN